MLEEAVDSRLFVSEASRNLTSSCSHGADDDFEASSVWSLKSGDQLKYKTGKCIDLASPQSVVDEVALEGTQELEDASWQVELDAALEESLLQSQLSVGSYSRLKNAHSADAESQ